MIYPVFVLFLVLVLGSAVHAVPPPSYGELLKLGGAQSVLDDLGAKLDGLVENAFYLAVAQDRKTPEVLAYGEAFRKKLLADFHRENGSMIWMGPSSSRRERHGRRKRSMRCWHWVALRPAGPRW